jgi:hypothetical protein
MNLLSGEFRTSVSEILDQAIQALPSGSRTHASSKSRATPSSARAII